uniref:Uncharacterized protein n=1 Tax=Chenopodium quinoa TaxID=63459 RepID=A0A803L604_CHEQI
MSLNCCHVLHRTDSDQDLSKRLISHDDKSSTPKNISSLFSHKILAERSWSGKLMASPREKKVKSMVGGATPKKFKAHHRRYGSTGALSYGGEGDDLTNEPKLVRSGGLRRDWSLEDLEAELRDGKRSKQRRMNRFSFNNKY